MDFKFSKKEKYLFLDKIKEYHNNISKLFNKFNSIDSTVNLENFLYNFFEEFVEISKKQLGKKENSSPAKKEKELAGVTEMKKKIDEKTWEFIKEEFQKLYQEYETILKNPATSFIILIGKSKNDSILVYFKTDDPHLVKLLSKYSFIGTAKNLELKDIQYFNEEELTEDDLFDRDYIRDTIIKLGPYYYLYFTPGSMYEFENFLHYEFGVSEKKANEIRKNIEKIIDEVKNSEDKVVSLDVQITNDGKSPD